MVTFNIKATERTTNSSALQQTIVDSKNNYFYNAGKTNTELAKVYDSLTHTSVEVHFWNYSLCNEHE